MKRLYYALYIGFFAGLFWGLVGWVMYYFGFTKVLPAFLVEPFFLKGYMHSWPGHFTGLAAFIVFSMTAAIIYSVAFQKLRGPWPGIGYGLGWWWVMFFFIAPFFDMTPSFSELSFNTHASEACRFVLWGVFIGYSITVEFTDEREREPAF